MQHLPSPGLPDLDLDFNSLEADALLDDDDDDEDDGGGGKRGRDDDFVLPFSQDLPEGLEGSDDE